MKTPLIFVISGKAQSGKDTTVNIILEYFTSIGVKAAKIAYAKYIKMYAMDYFGWDGKEETKPRDTLQMLGTSIREKFNKPLFFVNRMKEDLEILSNFFDVLVISDARAENEIIMPKENFKNTITFRIIRNKDNGLDEKQKLNYTETALDNYNDYDYIINNDGSIEDLKNKIIDIISRRIYE